MARIGIVYRKDDILDIILDEEPNFVGIAIGKRMVTSADRREFDGGLEYPFVPQIYKIFSYDRPIGYRSVIHIVPRENISYARYNRDSDVYDIMVERDELTVEDRVEFYNDHSELTFPYLFDFSFFSKQELETVLSLSSSRVIVSGSKIQVGRGALDYGGGAFGPDTDIFVFTLKMEADPITEAADLGLPEWIAGAPCPPRWR